uniref:apolipoprotein L3-like n=1 Tax=Semicossyphus pulcher TaxID=241346 RepID=UPI0037E76C33
MCCKREKLQEALCVYVSDTLSHADTVRGFCHSVSTWMDDRKSELTKINKQTNQPDLAAVLKDTLGGLETLGCFLEAVEELAVTSLHVFMQEKQVTIHLPAGVSLEHVQVVIVAARLICPLLLQFKRDPNVCFVPRVQNVEVLAHMLERYLQTTQRICDLLQKCSLDDFGPDMKKDTAVELAEDFSADDLERMLVHMNQLTEIRMDVNFRMVFLFQEVSCSGFMGEFEKRQPRMLQFLKDLEGVAVQLDSMNKGAKISNVVSSSVGAVGGALIIAGLVLTPFTLGTSLALTVSGLGLGITSGVNGVVTTATKLIVNKTQQGKANRFFQSFMDDVQSLQDRLQEVTSQLVTKIESHTFEVFLAMGKICLKVYSILNQITSLNEAVSAALESEEMVVSAGEVAVREGRALRNLPELASEVPEVAMAAVKAPLRELSAIGLNVFFIGLDIVFIVIDSVSLARGSETEASQLIRARSALWKSEIDSWEKIHDALSEGLPTSEEKRAMLESAFYCGDE